MSSQQGKSGNGALFAIGAVLWVGALAALYFTWSNRRNGDVSPGGSGVGKPIPVAELTSSASASEADAEREAGKPPRVEIPMTWPEKGVEDFVFTDQTGQEVSKNDLLGKPWLASFVFTKCAGPCPKVTSSVQEIVRRYVDTDVRFVTFTVDPARDTPEALARYAEFHEADPEKWFFLTGDRDKLYGLINGSFLMPVQEAENPDPGYEIIHTTNICLVDPTGRVVGKYNSLVGVEMVKLRRDLDQMLHSRPVPEADSSAGAGRP